METNNIILMVILCYLVVTVVLGLYVSSKKKAKTSNEFLMANKALGPFVLAATLFAADTGGASTTGVANNVYDFGISASWYVISSGIAFMLISFIVPYFRKCGANTVPDIVNKRYGKGCHIFTGITSILALFMATGAQIIATATIINVLSGLEFNIAVLLAASVVLIYTMIGGFRAITAVNFMHVFFITIGMGVGMLFMVNNDAVGGFSALFEKAASMENGADFNLVSMTKVGFMTIISYIVMYCMTFPTGQEVVQTYCSAKDSKSAKLGSIMAGCISCCYAIIPAMIGLVAYTCIDGYYEIGKSSSALADAAINFAPPLVAGVLLASIVAATMSSASNNMLATATMFTKDIYTPYINKNGNEIMISRIVMVVACLVGVGVALTGSDVISTMMKAFALRTAGPIAAFLCGLFYKNVTKNAGFISITAGTLMAVYWIFGLGTPNGISAVLPGSIVGFAVIFIVSFIERKRGVMPLEMIKFESEV